MSESDDLGGLEGIDDGEEELGDLDDGGENLGGLDDGFDEMDGGDEVAGGGNVDELEHRLDELENEVGSLSSTVNTVRNENEQISNSVEEVEENVRKLLDIYEMVTRGVNPFADEMDGGMGMGGGGMEAQESSFGLFTDEEDEDEESVDEDITDADAEGFFDDDLVEDEQEDIGGLDGGPDEGNDEPEGFGGDFEEMNGEESFEGGEEFDEMADDRFDDHEMGGEDGFDEMAAETGEIGADSGDTGAEETQTPVEPTATETTEYPADHSQADESAASGSAETGASDRKPYLGEIPDGFTGDLVVVEWLEFLVAEVGARGALEAIRFYETIDWVTEAVADELEAHVAEFNPGRRGALSADHHRQSLAYIDQLSGGEATATVFGGGESS